MEVGGVECEHFCVLAAVLAGSVPADPLPAQHSGSFHLFTVLVSTISRRRHSQLRTQKRFKPWRKNSCSAVVHRLGPTRFACSRHSLWRRKRVSSDVLYSPFLPLTHFCSWFLITWPVSTEYSHHFVFERLDGSGGEWAVMGWCEGAEWCK